MVSSLSPYNLHLLFWGVLFILASIWLVLMALVCTAMRGDSVSLIMLPFLTTSMFSRLRCYLLVFQNIHRVAFRFLVIVILYGFVLSVSFLVSVISPPSGFSMQSLSRRIDVPTSSSILRIVLFLPFFIHIICHRLVWDIMPYVWLLDFFGPFA